MALRYVAGYQSNLLQRAASITVTNEDSALPKAYLHDGTGAVFMGSAEVSPFNITIDLGETIPNGGFETAFVGGLPTAAWGKTAGATLTRNTAIPQTGAACLQADGTVSDYAYFDLTAYPGQRLKIQVSGRISAAGAACSAALFNLDTGSGMNTDGSWNAAALTAFFTNPTTAYTSADINTTVESPEGGPIGAMTLRLALFCDNAAGAVPVYDDVAVYYAVNFASVHWHNLVGITSLSMPTLRSSTDGFSGSNTLEATMAAGRPAFYSVLGSTVYRRYWRLNCVNDTTVKNGGNVPYIGEFVLGYAEAAARAQDYGWNLSKKFQQVRTITAFGAEAVYAASPFEQRRLALQFSPTSAAEFLELRDRLYRATRGGADPLVIVPYDSENTVIHGRLGPELAHGRELLTRWNLGLEVLETAPPVIVS